MALSRQETLHSPFFIARRKHILFLFFSWNHGILT